MSQLDADTFDEIKEIFDHFDSDANGVIDYGEFSQILDALKANMTDEEMKIGFNEIDTDDNHAIDFDEFIAWWSER